MGDNFLPNGWNSISQAYDSFSTGVYGPELLLAVEKELERQLVRTVFAPGKLKNRNKIKKQFNTTVKTVAKDTKTSLEAIAKQLDSEIKGEFSTAVQTTISEKNSKWDDL